MEIEIRNYENTNGKSPKGCGVWIFVFDKDVPYVVEGDYKQAAEAALHVARVSKYKTISLDKMSYNI